MKGIICIVIVLCFLSCTNHKQVTSLGAIENKSIQSGIPTEDRIAFVTLKITADSVTGTNEITILEKTLNTGHLKSNNAGAVRSNNYLTCILYNDSKEEDTIRIDHPLFRVYEYKNEKNEMSVKEVKNKEAEFFLRFQLKGKSASVKIIETLNGVKTRELITFSL